MKRSITLGPLETALVITGGNWDAEGVCELVTCFFSDETGFIEANVYGSHNALGRVEGWICAAHFDDDRTLYVQDPEKTEPIASDDLRAYEELRAYMYSEWRTDLAVEALDLADAIIEKLR